MRNASGRRGFAHGEDAKKKRSCGGRGGRGVESFSRGGGGAEEKETPAMRAEKQEECHSRRAARASAIRGKGTQEGFVARDARNGLGGAKFQ